MNSKIGTLVKVSEVNNEFIAHDPAGNVITDVPTAAMARAFGTGMCLEKLETTTGGVQWRQRPMDKYVSEKISTITAPSPSPVQSTTHEVNTNQVNVAAGNVEIPTDHKKVVTFIKDSIKLKPKLLKIDDLKWRMAVREVIRGQNLLIRGESGCGKTLLANVLKDVFGRPFFYFNLGATQDPRSTLIGNTHFKKDEGTYVAEALFVKAIQTENAIILLDEVSRAHPDAHNILMSVLDQKQRYLRIDERPDTPTINVAPGVTFIGTANVGAEYTATRTMDRAFVDRWSIIMMEPLTKVQELELLTEMFPEVDSFDLNAIAEIADKTRQEVKSSNPKVDTIISTRITTEMAALLYDGFTLAEAASVKVYPFYPDAGGAESQRAYIAMMVQGYVRVTPSTPSTFDPNKLPPKNKKNSPLG